MIIWKRSIEPESTNRWIGAIEFLVTLIVLHACLGYRPRETVIGVASPEGQPLRTYSPFPPVGSSHGTNGHLCSISFISIAGRAVRVVRSSRSGFLPWMRSACRPQSTPAQRTHALPPKLASRVPNNRARWSAGRNRRVTHNSRMDPGAEIRLAALAISC